MFIRVVFKVLCVKVYWRGDIMTDILFIWSEGVIVSCVGLLFLNVINGRSGVKDYINLIH
jgi:hypothetical protein